MLCLISAGVHHIHLGILQVHNNAGSDCILKESMQLNFDEDA